MEFMEEFKIPDEALERLNDPDLIRQQIADGSTFQQILGYSDETMEKFYKAARSLFAKEEYKKSADAFVFLTQLNPGIQAYWLGLAMSEQLLRQFHAALVAYAMAILVHPRLPVAHYQSSRCFVEIGDRDSALQSIEMAIHYSEEDPSMSMILENAIAYKSKLERDKSN